MATSIAQWQLEFCVENALGISYGECTERVSGYELKLQL